MLHVSVIVCAAILLSIWVYSLGRSLTSPETEAKINEGLEPFSALKGNLIGGYQSISNPEPTPEETAEEYNLDSF